MEHIFNVEAHAEHTGWHWCYEVSEIGTFFKKKSVGYQAKKSKVLTRDQINLFLEKASDENYLLWKVNIKFFYDKLYNMPFFRSFESFLSGAMRRDELTKMSIDDIKD
jgi:hypothetical protein